jgi:cation-transporting ATPase 13A1
LTAIAVAAQTKMSSLPPIVFCEKTNTWRDAFGGHMEKFEETKVAALRKKHTLCVLGQSLSVFPSSLLVFVTVFARCSPAHKEQVVTRLKSRHVHTLMCGDGTNDVSALKQADVGIALVFQEDEEVKISASEAKKKAQPAPKQPVAVEKVLKNNKRCVFGNCNSQSKKVTGILIIDRILQASEGQEEQSNMNMGDASIAAPFTVRAKNIAPVTLFECLYFVMFDLFS